MRILVALSLLAASLVAAVGVAPSADAAETTYDACPASASAWDLVAPNLTQPSDLYPPFTTPSADDVSDLVDCASPFQPPVPSGPDDILAAVVDFSFDGLPDDPCYEVTEIVVTTSGAPEITWAFLPFNTASNDPVTGPTGTGNGAVQGYNYPSGVLLPVGLTGVLVYSPSAQPASGTYDVSYEVDPSEISLADLAAGNLGAVILPLADPGDGPQTSFDSIEASVTVDDSACPGPTTTTTSTTTTAPAPLPVTPTTIAARAVATTPSFTG